MSSHVHPATSAVPSFTAAVWDVCHPNAHETLRSTVTDARVIRIGKSAHFVAELGAAHSILVQALIQEAGVVSLALEVGRDEALIIEQWLTGERLEELRTLAGPLTIALYGSFFGSSQMRV